MYVKAHNLSKFVHIERHKMDNNMKSENYNIGMYVVDSEYKMIYMNEDAKKIYPEIKVGALCHKALAGLDSPCGTCPISHGNVTFYSTFRKEWISAQSAEIDVPNIGKCYDVQFQLKQRISSLQEEYNPDVENLRSHIKDITVVDGTECIIGGYCETDFPLFYVNDNMAAMLGYDNIDEFRAAIDGMVINTVHPDDREMVAKDIGENYQPGDIYETIYRMPRKDGSWIIIINKGKVIQIENGRLAIISACSDMSNFMKRQSEIAMQNAEMLRKDYFVTAMMENMPSGYHRCEAKKGCPFIFIGKHFENIVGWTKEEIEVEFDNLYVNLIWPEDVAVIKTYEDMLGMIGSGNSYSTDIYRIKRKGGGYRWVLDSTMFVDLGEDSFFQATLADITDFVESEREQRIKLEEAMVRVEEANNAKTQFLSSMSHDIRTPMNAIVGMTALAAKHLDDPEYMKKCLNRMTLASNHLLTLINDVLDISKVESGKMSLNPIVFSLADTLTNLVNIVRQQISGKGQKFDVRVHNVQKELLFGDELRLNQIFINILTNAVKYTPEGGVISVDIKEEDIPGVSDRVRIIYIVEDSGVGMSQEFQDNMYNSFVRASNDNFGAIQGTGLGLTISKRMIDLMNGTIECESELGKGTKFTVTIELPLADRMMDDLMLPPMEALLVDDDEMFLETAADTLRDLGISPSCVSSGAEAVSVVGERHKRGNDFPVIIVDWQMPDMNGIETIKELRTIVGKEVSIIVVSAYEWGEIEDAAKAAGADGFICKPFFRSSVYENMMEILGLTEIDDNVSEEKQEYIYGMNVLIAEDNDINWEVAREIMDMYGVNCVRAENGQICVDMINEAPEGKYDMILMDIKMPVLDGYEATEVIRSSEKEYVRNIPIVAMTADAFSEDIQRSKEVGMNGHIAKPININNLLTILGKFGGGRALDLRPIN